jgi:hypothetical protein
LELFIITLLTRSGQEVSMNATAIDVTCSVTKKRPGHHVPPQRIVFRFPGFEEEFLAREWSRKLAENLEIFFRSRSEQDLCLTRPMRIRKRTMPSDAVLSDKKACKDDHVIIPSADMAFMYENILSRILH